MGVIFSPPPRLSGSTEEQLSSLYGYLIRLSGELEVSLSMLEKQEAAVSSQRKARSGDSRVLSPREKELEKRVSSLKSLLIKTGHLVESRMDTLETELRGNYVTEGDFGTYRQETEEKLTANAESLTQAIHSISEVTVAGQSRQEQLEQYITETEGYIRQGIVGYDGEVPLIGIAIGRNVTTTGENVTVDGQTYDVIATTRSNMSVWTTNRLSFFVSGRETGWFSGDALHVNAMEAESAIRLVEKWEMGKVGGFTIKWIGGSHGT